MDNKTILNKFILQHRNGSSLPDNELLFSYEDVLEMIDIALDEGRIDAAIDCHIHSLTEYNNAIDAAAKLAADPDFQGWHVHEFIGCEISSAIKNLKRKV